MQVGLIGAGSMAAALARGWGEPVVVSDPVLERAEALAVETGGRALATNLEVAQQVDLVVLCHKPAQLQQVAAELDGNAKAVISILGSVSLAEIRSAYTRTPAYRVLPNLPVEVGKGVLCWPSGNGPDGDPVRALFGRLGHVVDLDEDLIERAMALSSNAPGFLAFVVEAFVDAGVEYGLDRPLATELVMHTLSGTAELLQVRQGDAERLRREVCSPGGSTERGVAALEATGLRDSFKAAVKAVLEPSG
ncbi:MAG: pyrroline-5-carboxylate reductase [Actinomycetes bacterium]